MTLRDYMVYAGIRTSRRFCKLSWFHRDLFMGVLHACDDYGRFEADAEKLWSVLYALDRARVTMRDVQEGLRRMGAQEIGLVKYYTVRGVGYGKVHNYRQTGLKKRRALYPDEVGHEPELWEPPPVEVAPERKKEFSPHSPPPAGGGEALPDTEQAAKATALPVKPARFRRAERLETLHEERERIEEEMRAILRPGGCAYNIEPTGEKRARFDALKAAHAEVLARVDRRRRELGNEGKSAA